MSNNSKIQLFDSQISLDDERFAENLDQLLSNAMNHHVTEWMIPATTANTFGNIQSITQQYKGCYAAFGLHPYFIHDHTEQDLMTLKDAIIHHRPAAIGECGLDNMIAEPDLEKQLKLFKAHVQLALEFDLPLIIHARKTEDLILKEIRKYPTLRGVFHSFSGSLQQAEIALRHNFLLGFGGTITFERARKLRTILKHLSLNDFIIETDAPFQRGAYRDNGLNYPADLLEIAKSIAIIREEPLETIAHATKTNAQKLFKLKDL